MIWALKTGAKCKRCKLPFVGEHTVVTTDGVRVAKSTVCPDCSEGTGKRPESELDTQDYIRLRGFARRLRDGAEMLNLA
jgi:hypothetical protein